MEQRVSFHLAIDRRFGVDRAEQRFNALNIFHVIRYDQSPPARQGRHRAGVRQHRRYCFPDFLRIHVVDVEHHRDDFARPHIAAGIPAAHDLQRHRRKLFEWHEAQIVSGFDERDAFHREHQVQRVERFLVGVGPRIVEAQRAHDVRVANKRFAGHALKLQTNIFRGRGIRGRGGVCGRGGGSIRFVLRVDGSRRKRHQRHQRCAESFHKLIQKLFRQIGHFAWQLFGLKFVFIGERLPALDRPKFRANLQNHAAL